MSDKLFPSGPWTGFYQYRPKDKHRMDLFLTFVNGSIHGDGNDDLGRFAIKGRYDEKNLEAYWTKTYVDGHDVHYRGFREGKGIWGAWEIGVTSRGGFHIWPQALGETNTQTEAAAEKPPVGPLKAPFTRQRSLRPIRRSLGKPPPETGGTDCRN